MGVSDVRKHLATMEDASKAYAEATSLSFKLLLMENDHIAKDLQEARQKAEQFAGSAMKE